MHPFTRNIANYMRDYGLTVLAKGIVESVFADITICSHALAIVHAAHGAEIVVKARIGQEHPLLIFDKLPKYKVGLLDIEHLLEEAETIKYSDLPKTLWATTGHRMPEDGKKFLEFGRRRNSAVHLAPPTGDLAELTLRFAFDVMEPLVNQFGAAR